MARFFVQNDSVEENMITITGPDVRHISKVLRLVPGDKIGVSTGNGREFEAVIREITTKEVISEIVTEKQVSTEAPVRVNLYQGLPKGDKMELIIQKSTEIGVSRIIPVISERTVVKLDGKKAGERRQRWQRIAEEAAKQSRRTAIPQVEEPVKFEAALQGLRENELVIMPWEEQKSGGIKQLLKNNAGVAEISIFIGPEGGFSQREARAASEKGVHLITLGPRIMRTETAGIVTAAITLYELGDLGGVDDG